VEYATPYGSVRALSPPQQKGFRFRIPTQLPGIPGVGDWPVRQPEVATAAAAEGGDNEGVSPRADSTSSGEETRIDATEYELVSADDASAPLGPTVLCH